MRRVRRCRGGPSSSGITSAGSTDLTITAPTVHPSDTASALRDLLDATADALTTQPEAAVIHPAVSTSLVPSTATEVRVRAGRHAFTIDEPPVLGGTDLGANPVEHLLASLGSCQVITYQVWAAKLGIAVDSIEVNVRVAGPEPFERYVELTAAVEEHCPVLDVLVNAVPVRSSYSYNEA